MTELPLRCICGYQKKIERLEEEVKRLKEELAQMEKQRDHWEKAARYE